MKIKRIVIGLVGPIASGKGVVAKLLEKRGFSVFSLSRIVRDEVARRGLSPVRKNLQDVGDDLRKKFGGDILARRTAKKAIESGARLVVIDAIRNPSEIIYLKKNLAIKIIGVDATAKKRFRYALKRAYPYDPKTWEEFLKAEKRDRGIGQNKLGQQVGRCLAMAEVVIKNNGTLKDLEKKVEKILENFNLSAWL